jgi:8-oxo-dGTP diphosphatase
MVTHIVAKTLIFDDQGKVLLLVRSDDDKHRPGGYDIPGGKVDDGEGYAEGAAREALEEAGLQLAVTDMHLAFATAKANFNRSHNTEVSIVWLGYVAKLPAGSEVKLSHEHQLYKWLSIEEAAAVSDGITQGQFLAYLREHQAFSEYWQKS